MRLEGRVASLLIPDHGQARVGKEWFLSEAEIMQLSLVSACGSPEIRRDHLTLKTSVVRNEVQ